MQTKLRRSKKNQNRNDNIIEDRRNNKINRLRRKSKGR